MSNYIRRIIHIIKRINQYRELKRYNSYNISEYFRKQGAVIGVRNRIEVRDLGIEPYLIKIGDHCTIAQGVSFLNHDGGSWLFTDEDPSLQKFGTIQIMDNCFIGHHSIILPNIVIGPNSIVGAGSVVTKNVKANMIFAGNPAKEISDLATYEKKLKDNWRIQKPKNYFRSVDDEKLRSPAYAQSIKYRDGAMLREHLIKLFSKELD